MIKNLEDVITYGYNIMGYDKHFKIKVLYETDGTEIESDEILQFLIDEKAFPSTILMLVPEGCTWADDNHNTLQTVLPPLSLTPDTHEALSLPLPHSYGHINIPHNTDLDSFSIPWGKLPTQFLKDCENGVKPSLDMRREAIRQIVSCIREITTHPPRRAIEDIARKIVSRYPKSLEDVAGSKRYEHLFEQIENRLYHLNRTKSKMNSRSLLDETEIVSAKRKKDAHGCANWMPEIPEGETPETLNKIQLWLLEQSKENADSEEIILNMNKTYVLQRLDINKKNFSISEVFSRWPYLFRRKFFLQHSNHLLGFDVEKKWIEELLVKVPIILNYFKSLSRKSVSFKNIQKTIKEIDSYVNENTSKTPEACSLMLVLCQFFGEEESTFVQYFEVCIFAETIFFVIF